MQTSASFRGLKLEPTLGFDLQIPQTALEKLLYTLGVFAGKKSFEGRGEVRGKYTERYRAGTNLVFLSPDVAEHFPDDRAVNAALRRLIRGSAKGRSARHAE